MSKFSLIAVALAGLLAPLVARGLSPAPGQGEQERPPTNAEQEEISRGNILPKEQAPFLRWLRAGKPDPTPKESVWGKLGATVSKTSANCVNGDLELNNFTNWSFAGGQVINGQWQFTAGPPIDYSTPVGSRHSLIPHAGSAWATWNLGHDPHIGTTLPVPLPNGGAHTLKLGDAYYGGVSGAAMYSFTVTPTTQNFAFRYAIVGQEGGHATTPENPNFSFILVDLTPTSVTPPWGIITQFSESITSANPKFQSAAGLLFRRPTSYCFHIPAQFVGHQFAAIFVAKGCMHGGHFGYAYVDSLCDETVGQATFALEKETFCDSEKVMVDASQSDFVSSHQWTMQQCDASGTPVAGTEATTGMVQGQMGPAFDILAWYKAHQSLECGKYYKITLNAVTDCSPNAAASKIIYIDCCKPCCEGNVTIGPSDLRVTQTIGTYAFNPPVTYAPGLVKRVEVSLVNSVVAVSPLGCGGTGGPVSSYIKSGGAVSGFGPATSPVSLFSRIIRWSSPGANLAGGAVFPLKLAFPPPQPLPCNEYLQFTLKYEVTDTDCRTCEVYKTYYFHRRPPKQPGDPEGTPIPIAWNQWPSVIDLRDQPPKTGGGQ